MALESSANLNGFKEVSSFMIDDYGECVGTSAAEFFQIEELDSTVDETSDNESNISTDIEHIV